MGRDPLAPDDEILATTFYGSGEGQVVRSGAAQGRTGRARKKTAPSHYKIVSISLYNEDLERIDRLVQALKDAGHTKANRSSLIRYAIDTVDIDGMPKSY